MSDNGKTRTVGLTGGIGSGKSTVGGMLARRGYTVIDSDRIARELTEAGSPVLDEIGRALGAEVLTDEGDLDREKVADIVFSDREKLSILESILHPAIVEEYQRRIRESDDHWIFLLIPLLFEAGREGSVDKIWLCYAPEEIRIERTIKRDGTSRDDVLARISMQMPDEEKLSKADIVIDTSGSLEDVERQVEQALRELEVEG